MGPMKETKTMEIIKILFGHCVGKCGPGTKLPHILCDRPTAARCWACFIYSHIYYIPELYIPGLWPCTCFFPPPPSCSEFPMKCLDQCCPFQEH